MEHIDKYIHSFMLGDGCLHPAGKRGNNCRYHLSQIATHKDYIDWQKTILEEICPVYVRYKPAYIDSNGWNHNNAYALHTRSLQYFTDMYNKWYVDKKKSIFKENLNTLDLESLAILYMDDGSLCAHSGRSRDGLNIVLCTMSFTYNENIILRDWIEHLTGVTATILPSKRRNKTHYILKYRKKDVFKFIKCIKPYILPSFEYKIEVPNECRYIGRKNIYVDDDIV